MDERNEVPPRSGATGREAFLAIVLCTVVGSAALVFLVFVSFGLFAWVVLIAVAMGFFAGLHYLLWGRSFEESIAKERQALADEPAPPAPGERRF